MKGTAMTFREEFCTRSAVKLSTQNAWALYVRRRWPANTIKAAMAEWGLSDGEARGLVYGSAGHATLDKILDHKRGGFGLALLILEIRMQLSLRDWIETEQERLTHDAERAADEARTLGLMASRLPTPAGGPAADDRRAADRETGSGHEARSFRPARPAQPPV